MDCSPSEFRALRRRARRQIDEDKALLQALVKQRHAMDVRQEELAFRMGITQPAVSAIETGNSSPTLSTLGRYANALGCIITHDIRPDNGGTNSSGKRHTVALQGSWPDGSAPKHHRDAVATWKA
ncbi:helix-turn-helix transcriptional regulator [Bifidobacterium pseudolongum]|uniref:helix-turn-helix domain-containing protein n=1 Tax=Bifidobacterium pseudolongum TaxID=1694 RepID=UPI001F118E0F|nr:helix-turn-helix transcriptional regulator [Bifidobacterium pseudolongum]MCH4835337.1 helix-turn-helix transcriptional regulator [Bifidobacterium pseudolongum]